MSGRVARVLVIAAVATFLWLFVRQLDVDTLTRELAHTAIWPLAIAAVLQFAALACKAACWHLMLAPRHLVKTSRLWRYTVAAFAASAITPARAGEAVRVWLLARRDAVPFADSAAVAVAEKVLDGAAMFVVVAPIPFALPGLPPWVASTVIAGVAGVAIALALLSLAVRRVGPSSQHWLAKLVAGMHVLRSPRRIAGALAALLAAWLVDLAMVELVLYALGVPLPIAGALLVLLTVNLAILVPATPAQLGVHEAGALVGLHLLHVPTEQAFGFALLYHAIQVILPLAIGSVLVTRGLTRIGPEKADLHTV